MSTAYYKEASRIKQEHPMTMCGKGIVSHYLSLVLSFVIDTFAWLCVVYVRIVTIDKRRDNIRRI